MPTLPRSLPALLVSGALLLAGCGGAPATAVAPTGHTGARPASVSQLPRDLDGYTLVDTSAFDEANAGVSYRYRGAHDLRADVYLYPHRPLGWLCRGKCPADAARAEAQGFRDLLPALIERGYYDSMVVVRDEPIPAPAGAWVGEGRHLTLRTVSHGRTSTSHFIVWAGLESFLKIRATYPLDAIADSQVVAFADQVVRRTPAPYTCAAGYSEAKNVAVSTTLHLAARDVVGRIDSALHAAPTPLDFRSPAHGVWRTAPTFSWPRGTATERWTAVTNPGYVLFVLARPAGDSTSVEFSAQTLCAPEPARDSVARSAQETLPMLAALLSMGALMADSTR